MSFEFEPAHVEQLVCAIPSMITERAPWLEALLEGIGDVFQCLDNEMLDLITSTTLATSTGIALDRFGQMIGVPRRGLSDDNFRRYLLWRAVAKKSAGGRYALLQIQKLPGMTVDYSEAYPAAVDMTVTFDDPPAVGDGILEHIADGLEETTALGVGIRVVERRTGFFRLDSSTYGLDSGKLSRRIV